ncbi:hypothetical protein SAMN05421813_1521 [Daejeonella rubra]|uniref:Uncharacterized protein n=1 Tax=Daejeonella rubra TaxID=990371 RepID=A0A1G9Z245_9SPHI|nr:hypothetical protein SAMN05421813_1521 [Daejeonella rubra]
MKANHNYFSFEGKKQIVVVNISSSKNESKSQLPVDRPKGKMGCCKYQ